MESVRGPDHIAIRTSSYYGIDKQEKTVRVHAIDYLVSRLDAGDRLLLVDDVFDSGRSIEAVISELRRRCRRNFPEDFRTATVYYKPLRNRSSLVPDYCVREVEEWLVFPHELQGLSREEMTDRLFLPMFLEATRVVEEGIVREPAAPNGGRQFGRQRERVNSVRAEEAHKETRRQQPSR